jgi:phosphoglycerate kinase
MAKQNIQNIQVSGRRVFVRVDYNVPLEERGGQMVITDDTRIRETLPTLEWLIENGARIVLASHLGRPKAPRDPALSLRPVAARLADLLARPVAFVDDCIGDKAEQTAAALQAGDVLLLENVRYYKEEEANDPAFAERLARGVEVYVDDAFGAAHRAHASTHAVPELIRKRGGVCAAGLLMQRELRYLGDELEVPARPFLVILGGAKVSDKIKVIDRLLEKADVMLIGGAMAYTFRLALGLPVGKSLVEPDRVAMALAALEKAKRRGVPLHLPKDNIVATPVDSGRKNAKGKPIFEWQNPRHNDSDRIPDAEEGLDIGPRTIQEYQGIVQSAKTILWNGPMGAFEDSRFAAGTFAIAKAVAEATQRGGAKSVIGGGDSIKALNACGLGSQVTFMSTGGGASLEFLEGTPLPGLAALSDTA